MSKEVTLRFLNVTGIGNDRMIVIYQLVTKKELTDKEAIEYLREVVCYDELYREKVFLKTKDFGQLVYRTYVWMELTAETVSDIMKGMQR